MVMVISPYGEAFIKHFEGCKLKPYRDLANLPTIGWGRRISWVQEKLYWGGITQAQADDWLQDDLGSFSTYLSSMIKVALPQNKFDAVGSLSYNIGISAFNQSTFLKYLNASEFTLAQAEFPKWCHAKGAVIEGLLHRRQAEAMMFRYPPSLGEYPEDYIKFCCGLNR